MVMLTLQEAKAKLNRLVEAARQGEQVVLLRGSEVVASLIPLSSENLEIAPTLTDLQADRLRQEIKKERKKTFSNAEGAVGYLRKRYSSAS